MKMSRSIFLILIINICMKISICFNLIEHGCSAYDCKRMCLNSNFILPTPGDNGFKLEIEGIRDEKYIPERVYKVTLVGSYDSARNYNTEFRGFLVVSVPETWYDAMSFNPVGRFMINPNDREIKYTSGCSEMITHTNFESKKRVTFYWTAPKARTGCVSLKAFVMQTETLWFKDDGELTKVLCEGEEYTETLEIPTCCACGQAKYKLNFKGMWTKYTHPKDWPTNEGLTHWSNIIGATHSRNYSVWEIGGYASPGLKELAEFGIIRSLEEEIKNHSNYGVIRNIVRANGLWFPNVDKETESIFTVSNTHHLLSFASMFGPSPDWISGVSKLNLCQHDCTWAEEYEEELLPFDAGTDSGISYNSPNKPTIPQEKIRKITSGYPNDPKAPFYDPTGKPIPTMAKLSLKRIDTNGIQCPHGIREKNGAVESNTFDLNDLSDSIKRFQLINSESVSFAKKRAKNNEMKILENVDPRCMTTDWSEWSECSSTCGKGIRKRSRQYKNFDMAKGFCNEIINDHEMCLSINGECEDDEEATSIEGSDKCLLMTSWSEWSPCSTTCGKGFTIRIRKYLRKDLEKKCKSRLEEKRTCIINNKCIDESLLSDQERKRICSLEKKSGPCRMAIENIKYYYDMNAKRCLPFNYGGCRGNENNFENLDKCERICKIMNEENEFQEFSSIKQLSEGEIEEKKKTCLLPPEEGNCYESQLKYYFDRTKSTCLPFEFSGCGGNTNNFKTIAACESFCHPIIDFIKDDSNRIMNGKRLTIPEKKRICMSPAEKGTCSESIQRYTYSVSMGKCLLFDYSGCEGNLNNFETIEECESVCDILIQMAQQASRSELEANLEIQKKEMCMLPKEKGPCSNYQQRYFFNSFKGKCEHFLYGGCNGNNNNFESLDECESTCYSLIEFAENSQSVSIDLKPKTLSYDQRKRICKFPVNEGSCNGYLKRYFFNFFTRNCEPFAYTGCDGNENNFITYDDCMEICSNLNRNYTAEALNKSQNSNLMMYPIDCQLSEWNEWSDCSADQCNKIGFSLRSRFILSKPRYGGKPCPSSLNQTKICFKECESEEDQNVDCSVRLWSPWSECKMGDTCSEGFQERTSVSNKGCSVLRERRKCYLGPCDLKKIMNFKNLN